MDLRLILIMLGWIFLLVGGTLVFFKYNFGWYGIGLALISFIISFFIKDKKKKEQ